MMKLSRAIPAHINSKKQFLIPAVVILVTIFFASVSPAPAQSAGERRERSPEYTKLRKGHIAILKKLGEIETELSAVKQELSELKQLLKQVQPARAEPQPAPAQPAAQAEFQPPAVQPQAPPQSADAKNSVQGPTKPASAKPRVLSIAGAPYLGKPDAPVTLVEFSDYQCPYCSRHATRTMPQLVQAYVETGKLKYVQREFPIAKLHSNAPKAAEAALCAGDQGKYWDMHDRLYQNQRQIGRTDLTIHAENLVLDMASFNTCLDGNKYTQRVQNDIKDGVQAGVKATPSFFLGLTDRDDPTMIKEIRYYQGTYPYQMFQLEIDRLLALARLAQKGPGNEALMP